jgi:histidinol-phosphate phosphatase family protein
MRTLFLDRDGVINIRIPGEYVKYPDEFVPTEGMALAISRLATYFDCIVVITNQAGIGKGLMDEAALHNVHHKMLDLVAEAGGRIDGIYYCPHRSDAGCSCRKPATGMAWLALADFPDIDFSDAWLAGDSASDIEFGKRLGMRTALIAGKTEESELLNTIGADHRFENLPAFAKFIC